ncbi:hypothetical protein O181_043659 [Austropuccinia psidii MF-1]|uniref:Uncharacterized protein n=1 Tax=Austropuccinia psidii MF-1 TaxID=1389203 RepID=A0A9Q3DIH3_9BASI|nr:hypothetical protein [Austropuccinia psidii MF-1]
MSKPLEGGYQLLLTHQKLSGSGEDHEALRRMVSILLKRQGKKYKELIEQPKSFIHKPEEGVGNDPSFGEGRPSGIKKLQKCPKDSPKDLIRNRAVPRTIKERENQIQLAQNLPTRVQDPQIGAFIYGQCIQYGQNSYSIHSQGEVKDEKDFSTQIMDEIKHIKSSINLQLGKFDNKLNKLTSNINDSKRKDRNFTEWCKVKKARLESISNLFDRIESKFQVQNDELEDLSINNINDQLTILKTYVLEIVDNTNLLSTHLARSDSERQKSKNEIISNVEQIHKDYEPDSHIPRNSTPLTEEKCSVK